MLPNQPSQMAAAGAPTPEIHHREEIACIDGPNLDGILLLG